MGRNKSFGALPAILGASQHYSMWSRTTHTVKPFACCTTKGGMLPWPFIPGPRTRNSAPSALQAARMPDLTLSVGGATLYEMSTSFPVDFILASATSFTCFCRLCPALEGRFAKAAKVSSDASLGSLMEESIISGTSFGMCRATTLLSFWAMSIAFTMAAFEPLMSLMLMPTTILLARRNLVASIAPGPPKPARARGAASNVEGWLRA
mmetsp:Transcript_77437/g.250533  ORF Transcript_77437/g.250533 Transcript_77437/m.250533 type:complete len:208 (-) Transcript_77437:3-626(-)